VGWLIDRFGLGRVIVPGILVLFIGLVMCATIKTLTQYYIFYGMFMGSGISLFEYVKIKRDPNFVFLDSSFKAPSGWKTAALIRLKIIIYPLLVIDWMGCVLKTQFDLNETFS